LPTVLFSRFAILPLCSCHDSLMCSNIIMWQFPSFKYTAVNDDEHQKLKPHRSSIVPFIAASILCFILGFGASSILSSTCVETPHELSWTSFTPKTQWLEFQGRLMQKSPYRGMPSQSIDDAWGRYTFNEHFDGAAVVLKVTDEDVRASRKGAWMNSTARMDGQHLATLEIFHQLHCLVSFHPFRIPLNQKFTSRELIGVHDL
jgi:hypothetical protein